MTSEQQFVQVVSDPSRLAELDIRGWESALALGRRHGISGRWYDALERCGALHQVPVAVRDHLWADRLVAAEHARSMRWEANRVRRALGGLQRQVILLKGAAYVVAGIPCGAGRLVSDIDILVPYNSLSDVEQALRGHGWRSMGTNRYDDRYFRQWMHELPPMRHMVRGTVLDVHHNILPRTCRLCPPAEVLIERAIATPMRNIRVLDPVDMTIHSILHGFYNGEFTNCFRDVLDVHELISHFQQQSDSFWEEFGHRVEDLSLHRPAFYALRYARGFFHSRIPDQALERCRNHAVPSAAQKTMDWAVAKVFIPSNRRTVAERLAFRILQARSHWIKMPPVLLFKHLSYKLWLRLRDRFKEPSEVPT